MYLAGYTIECSLKALILELTPDEQRREMFDKITSSGKMHDPEILLGFLGDLGCGLPLELSRRLRRSHLELSRRLRLKYRSGGDRWAVHFLRYEAGRTDTSETRGFLKTATAIHAWVEGQLS